MSKKTNFIKTKTIKLLIVIVLAFTQSSDIFSENKIAYNKGSINSDETGCEYIIISPNADYFVQWANEIKNFRNKQGIITEVFTLEEIGGNSVNEIEDFLNNAYTGWDISPIGVLLLGDYGTNSENSIISPVFNGYCVADNMFADVDGDDLPEMVISRICATNQTELEIMINKFIEYESSPPVSLNFYQNPVTSVAFSTPTINQLYIEAIGGFWKNILNKEPVRINEIMSGDPSVDPWTTNAEYLPLVEYLGPNGLGYIPETPAELGGWTGGNASLINEAINQGAFMIIQKSHGNINGWALPSYTTADINGLTNEDPVFVLSIDCLTGKFNSSQECFAEKFHRYSYNGENSGALSVIAPSEVTYSFITDWYGWFVIDFLWGDFMPDLPPYIISNYKYTAFANFAAKHLLSQSTWPFNTSNKKVTYNLFHHFGDVFSVIYTEIPQTLTVVNEETIPEGADNISISAEEGTFICFSVAGEIIGRGEVQNSPEIIQIIPQTGGTVIDVVATKSNYFRYESSINVTGNGSSQDIQLTSGYQFVSSRIEPENTDMLIVLQDILNDNLDFVRNSNGETLRKIGPNWVNGIGDWISTEGYLFKMFGSENLEFSGVEIAASTPIDLVAGYQFVSYLPADAIDALYAFDGILGDNLEYIRNSNGEMLRKIGPNWVNGIGDAIPGEGYLIKMFADDELVYNIPVKSTLSNLTPKVIKHFIFEGGNAADPVFTMYVSGLKVGDEVAVYDCDILVGSTVIRSGNKFENSLPLFSTLTNEKGYNAGNAILLKVWDNKKQMEVVSTYYFESGFEAYTGQIFPSTDGEYSFVNILKGSNGIENNADETISIFPNPSEGIFNISFEGVSGKVQIKVFDVHGNNYRFFEIESIGNITEKLDLKELAAGVYFISFSSEDFSRVKKIVVQ